MLQTFRGELFSTQQASASLDVSTTEPVPNRLPVLRTQLCLVSLPRGRRPAWSTLVPPRSARCISGSGRSCPVSMRPAVSIEPHSGDTRREHVPTSCTSFMNADLTTIHRNGCVAGPDRTIRGYDILPRLPRHAHAECRVWHSARLEVGVEATRGRTSEAQKTFQVVYTAVETRAPRFMQSAVRWSRGRAVARNRGARRRIGALLVTGALPRARRGGAAKTCPVGIRSPAGTEVSSPAGWGSFFL